MFTFFDIVDVKANIHGLRLTFGVTTGPQQMNVAAALATSPLQAKLMAIVLAKRLHKWEEEFGEIVIPPELANNCGISPTEDW